MVTRPADPAEDGELFLVVNASTQGGRLRPYRGAPAGRRRACAAPTTARSSPCRARRPRPCSPATRPRPPAMAFMSARPHDDRRHPGPRLALRLHRRGRLRDLGRGGRMRRALWRAPARRSRASSRSASARAIRCGSRRGCASTATTSNHDLAGRGGADLVDPEAPARGGRLPGRRPHPARKWPKGRCARARRPQARGPRSGPRRRRDPRRPTGALVGKVTSGGFGPTRRRPGRHGLCRARVRRRPAPSSHLVGARQGRCRPRSCRCPSCRTATSAGNGRFEP